MLTITLKEVSVGGIYGNPPHLPKRMRRLHPDAADSMAAAVVKWGKEPIFSDMFRSPEASLQAMSEKRGVKAPGFSGHNFGFSGDVDVDGTCKLFGWSYLRLLQEMATVGWYCHRRDERRGPEDWHFNFFGKDGPVFLGVTGGWDKAVEAKIQDVYGVHFKVAPNDAQSLLSQCGFYHGAIDGALGPLSRESIKAFQRAWSRQATGELDVNTQRVLAVVSAKIVEV